MGDTQKKAVENHRKRLKARGFVRVEVQISTIDAPLIRRVAEVLRSDPARADRVRARLRNAIELEPKPSLLELLAVGPPDLDVDEFLTRKHDFGRDVEL